MFHLTVTGLQSSEGDESVVCISHSNYNVEVEPFKDPTIEESNEYLGRQRASSLRPATQRSPPTRQDRVGSFVVDPETRRLVRVDQLRMDRQRHPGKRHPQRWCNPVLHSRSASPAPVKGIVGISQLTVPHKAFQPSHSRKKRAVVGLPQDVLRPVC